MVAVSAVCVCSAVWVGDPTTPGGPLPLCPTKLLLGIDCPGCGGLRMLYCLMHGNLLAAARFNALGLVALVLLVWGLPGVVLWPLGRSTYRELAASSLGCGGDNVVGVGLVVGAQHSVGTVHRAACLTFHRADAGGGEPGDIGLARVLSNRSRRRPRRRR